LVPFSNAPPTAGLYTLSLHDALPISLVTAETPRAFGDGRSEGIGSLGITLKLPTASRSSFVSRSRASSSAFKSWPSAARNSLLRSEEHTSELQSLAYLVCRLLLEKKK